MKHSLGKPHFCFHRKRVKISYFAGLKNILNLFTDNRCATIRDVDHVITADGFMNATRGNTERMVCETGWTFADGSDYSDITCVVDGGGDLQWLENIPECEGIVEFFESILCFVAFSIEA